MGEKSRRTRMIDPTATNEAMPVNKIKDDDDDDEEGEDMDFTMISLRHWKGVCLLRKRERDCAARIVYTGVFHVSKLVAIFGLTFIRAQFLWG